MATAILAGTFGAGTAGADPDPDTEMCPYPLFDNPYRNVFPQDQNNQGNPGTSQDGGANQDEGNGIVEG
ncbi:hypothetical protein [Nocardia tengchongensis]